MSGFNVKRVPVHGLSKWPVNSTRYLLPVVAVRGWPKSGTVHIVLAWWIWRADWEIRRAER